MEVTDEGLLQKLKRTDAHDAWRIFFDRYSVAMLFYAQKLGLSEKEAEDAVQETMIALMRVLPRFRYNPGRGRFRNYLITILHRRCLQVIKRRPNNVDIDGLSYRETPALVEDGEDDYERHWRSSLVVAAWKSLCDDGVFDSRTMNVFEDLCFHERPVQEVCETYDLTANTVYQIKHRVTRRISAEVSRLSVELE